MLYAHGAPIIGDLGYYADINGKREGAVETWKHACVTFGGRTMSGYLGTETTLPAELWHSTREADLLVAYTPVEHIILEGRHTWRRRR